MSVASMHIALALLTLLAAAPPRPPPPPPPRAGGVLEPGKAAVDPLTANEAVEHAFQVAAGEIIHLEIDVDQTGLLAELRGPDGTLAMALQSHDDAAPLVFAVVATAGGSWRLTMRLAPDDTGGTIRTLLEPPRPPAARDATRLDGQRLLNEAKDRTVQSRVVEPGSEAQGPEGVEEGIRQADRAAALLGEAGDARQQAWALLIAADARYFLGQVPPAIAGLKLAAAAFERLGDEFGEIMALDRLATAEASATDHTAAVDHASRGLALALKRSDPFVTARLQATLGFTYQGLGEQDLAIEHLDEAVKLWRQVVSAGSLANTLDLRGLSLSHRGDHPAARRDHAEAQALWKDTGNARGQAISLALMAGDLYLAGRPAEMVPLLRASLALSRGAGDLIEESAASDLMALGLLAQGKSAEAMKHAQRGLALRESFGALDNVAASKATMAAVLLQTGQLVEALALARQAVALIETIRLDAAGSGTTGAFLAGRRSLYETLVEALARLDAKEPGRGHAEAALAVSEQAHARGVLELVGLARVDLRGGVDPQLLEQERAAAAGLAAASEQQARQAAGGRATGEERAAVDGALQGATRDLEAAQARIRAHSPRYAEVVQGGTLDLAGIRRELGDDTLLLEYLLGAEHSYLWEVGPEGARLHRLERRELLEAAARRLHRCWAERCPADQERRLAAEASRLLLGPARDRLRDRRLVIVADGALHYLPFAALPIPGQAQRLASAHELVNLPSMSTLAALRRQGAGREPAPLAVAVLADPVFEARDARVRAGAPRLALARPAGAADALARSSRDVGLGSLDRLRATRREGEAIAALVPAGQSLVALDFGASRELALGGELSRYRIVHFATHGLLDNRNPGLSGLVLSLVDEAGVARNGFLRTSDVFGLKLNADLVVLSACQTALGQEMHGEGLVGLTRGFMYAGAPRVLASLWMVPDGATAELMRRFYEAHLKQGLPAAAALRAAQRAMASEPRWGNPHDWAGFTLQGRWD